MSIAIIDTSNNQTMISNELKQKLRPNYIYTNINKEEFILNIGKKYKNKPLKDIPRAYLSWISKQENIFEPIKKRIQEYLDTLPPEEVKNYSNYILKNGKYKNKTLSEVDEIDHKYLLWYSLNCKFEPVRKIITSYLSSTKSRNKTPVITAAVETPVDESKVMISSTDPSEYGIPNDCWLLR
jgi:uncharacterized protein (DUF3820 family)